MRVAIYGRNFQDSFVPYIQDFIQYIKNLLIGSIAFMSRFMPF